MSKGGISYAGIYRNFLIGLRIGKCYIILDNCKIMHIGKNEFIDKYSLVGQILKEVEPESDLEVITYNE